MNLLIVVPRIIKSYIAQFPEVIHNAYPYFNYDNRVVEKRVNRGDDLRAPYKGASDFTDEDYDALVKYAQTIKNPILEKYCSRISNEDALHTAIKSFSNGLFDGKVNANTFEVLVKSMENNPEKIASKKKSPKPKSESPKAVKPHVLRELGLKTKDISRKPIITPKKGIPHFLKTDKGIVVNK